MTQEPTIDLQETDARARVLFGVIVVLLHVDEPEAVIVALNQAITDAFTEGFYAGIEAWDIAHRANGENVEDSGN